MANERAKEVIEALVDSVRQVIKEKNVNYDEFHAAVAFLVRLAAAGEIPLLLAVLLEATVDEVTHAASTSSTTTIQGPFYVPGAPLLEPPCKLPRRADEAGDVVMVSGTVRGTDGEPLRGAEIDMWQATGEIPGRYSTSTRASPTTTCAGASAPTPGGRSRWRPWFRPVRDPQERSHRRALRADRPERVAAAHLHFKVSQPGYRTLTTQLFFHGDDYSVQRG